MQKIIDQFTELPLSRQRKWQFRHPEQQAKYLKNYQSSEKGKLMFRHKYHKKIGKIFKNCPKCQKS